MGKTRTLKKLTVFCKTGEVWAANVSFSLLVKNWWLTGQTYLHSAQKGWSLMELALQFNSLPFLCAFVITAQQTFTNSLYNTYHIPLNYSNNLIRNCDFFQFLKFTSRASYNMFLVFSQFVTNLVIIPTFVISTCLDIFLLII